MSKFHLKKQATLIRKQGGSVLKVARVLGISKSTASRWCSEMILTSSEKNILAKKASDAKMTGRLVGASMNREKKRQAQDSAVNWARSKISNLSARDALIAGTALYWAEGSKASSTTGFIFVNSDPTMILFMFKWLQLSLGVPLSDIVVQISINEIHRSRINKVLNFWSNLLDLSHNHFLKTSFSKSVQKKVYHNTSDYFGMLRIGVRRSTYLKYQTLALIQQLKPM